MNIETKYSVDSTVWYVYANAVYSSKVKSISYEITKGYGNKPTIKYILYDNDDITFNEDELFELKEELLKTL